MAAIQVLKRNILGHVFSRPLWHFAYIARFELGKTESASPRISWPPPVYNARTRECVHACTLTRIPGSLPKIMCW
jgi:hypothetical protein